MLVRILRVTVSDTAIYKRQGWGLERTLLLCHPRTEAQEAAEYLMYVSLWRSEVDFCFVFFFVVFGFF